MNHILYSLFNTFHDIKHKSEWILQRNKCAQKHMYENWMNYNNLFITLEQLTKDIEVMTSFLSIFAYFIKELLTKSDITTDDIDVDMNR